MVEWVSARDTGAIFSPCRRWRYLLWRRWDPSRGTCVFICLNPSTADETFDDPTVRRCVGFARDWGYGELWVMNAYAFRATDPLAMKAAGPNALGPRNNEFVTQAAMAADIVIAAWGTHCSPIREREVRALVHRARKPLHHLGLTKHGHPKHPLYLRSDTQPVLWEGHDILRVV